MTTSATAMCCSIPIGRTITLRRPLTLDLGAVAKGLAVDTAARELEPFRDFAIDAGGDLYLGGSNPQGNRGRSGFAIRETRMRSSRRCAFRIRPCARPAITNGGARGETSHSRPAHRRSAHAVASATVVASGAMLADALATAAFVLGPRSGHCAS